MTVYEGFLTVILVAADLEAQALRILEDYVANKIREDSTKAPLRQVQESFCAWAKSQGLPIVPISANSIFQYAHHLFVDGKANWIHEYRLTMLKMLGKIRTVANGCYENDLRGNPRWRKAFLAPIFDTPEARALETVDRDLDSGSDDG